MGPGITLNCINSGGFNSNPNCKTIAKNQIAINFNTANIGSSSVFVIEITNMINPLFEGGNYDFTFELVRILFLNFKKRNAIDGGGSLISTTLISVPLTIKPPDISEISLNFASSVVWTESELSINLKSSYEIISGSKILLEIPVAYVDSGTSVNFIQTNSPSCTAITGIGSSLSCSFSTSTRIVKISGGFSSSVSSGTNIGVKIGNFFTPLSTSSISGFNVWITSSSEKKYMKKLDLSVKVDSPKFVDALNIVQPERAVGKSGSFILYLTLSAFATTDFWVEAVFPSNSGMDLTNTKFIGFAEKEGSTSSTVRGGGIGGLSLTNPDNVIILSNVKNRDWAEDTEITINIYDGNDNIAQKTQPKTLSFLPATIEKSTILANPTSLGSDTTITIDWELITKYFPSTEVKITIPNEFQKFPDNLECKNGDTLVGCTIDGDNISVTGFFLGIIDAGSKSSIKISGLRLPYCAANSKFDFKIDTSSGFPINTGSIIFKNEDFSKDTLTFNQITQSSLVSGKSNTFSISFSHNSVIKSGSKIFLTLNSEITWLESSTCSITAGLASGASCTHESGVLIISDGFTSDRSHGGINIVIQIANIGNPRGLGTYNIVGRIETGIGSICEYASGETSISITEVESMNCNITPAVNNRNIYTTYRIEVNPIHASWVNTDYIEVKFPENANTFFSETLKCTAISPNLISVTCTSEEKNTIKILTNVQQSAYSSNKKLEFDIDFIQNPDSEGVETGYEVFIVTQSGGVFLQDKSIDVIFAGHITPNTTDGKFFSEKKGDDNYLTVNIKVDAYIPSGGQFELEFVDPKKFEILGNETIKSSTPSFEIVQDSTASPESSVTEEVEGGSGSGRLLIDKANRKIRLKSTSVIQPNTDISFELNMRNPLSNTVAGPDLLIKLFINEKMVFEKTGFSSQYNFTCDPLCADCEKYYYHCTSCISGKVLDGSSCGDPKKETLIGKSIPFLFSFIALIMFLSVWLIGKYWRNRNFSGNYYYSGLKVLYLPALVGITIFFAINKDPFIYTILMIVMILIHIALSWVSARSFNTIYKSRKFTGCSIQGIPAAGKPSPLFFKSAKDFMFHKLGEAISKSDENYAVVGPKKEKEKLFKIVSSQIFLIFFHNQVTRMFFSSVSKGKSKEERKLPVTDRALFWTWDQDSFESLQNSYAKHRNYYLIFQFIVIMVLVFSCLGIGKTESYYYLFKFDLGLLTLIDILIYTYASNELLPKKKKNDNNKVIAKTKVTPAQAKTNEKKEESVKILKNIEEEEKILVKGKEFRTLENKLEKDNEIVVKKEDEDKEEIFPEIESIDEENSEKKEVEAPIRNVNRQYSVARSHAINSDPFMANMVIGTTKNNDTKNSTTTVAQKVNNIGKEKEYFKGSDGKDYKFTESGELIDKKGVKVSEEKKDAILDGVDLTGVKNIAKGSEVGDSRLPSLSNTQMQFSKFFH